MQQPQLPSGHVMYDEEAQLTAPKNYLQQQKAGRCDFPLVLVITVATVLGLATLVGSLLGYAFILKPLRDATLWSDKYLRFARAAVATDSPECSAMGAATMKRGGNAVDAAVTSALCLGVMRPFASGIGGGSFMVLKFGNESKFFNFREVAPLLATRDMYVENETLSLNGALAVAVPGELKGLALVHSRYGKLTWKSLVEPIAQLASNGFVIDRLLSMRLKSIEATILSNSYLRNALTKRNSADGTYSLLQQGDLFRREALGKTLSLLAEHGAQIMYGCNDPTISEEANVCKRLIRDVQHAGGILSEKDMEQYQVQETNALRSTVQFNLGEKADSAATSYEILTSTIPSSGPAIHFMFNVLEQLHKNLSRFEKKSDIREHLTIEITKHAFAHRMHMGDSMTNPDQFTAQLIDKLYAQAIASKVHETTFAWPHYFTKQQVYERIADHGTSHFSIVDDQGNVAAMTTTVNWSFGSKFISESTGIVLNNEMNDFTVNPNKTDGFGLPPSKANLVGPGKHPMSSMSPTIILDKNSQTPMLTLGASGGPTIISAVFQVASRALVWDRLDTTAFTTASGKLSLKQLIDKPRLHTQVGQDVRIEDGVPREVLDSLKQRGHVLVPVPILPDGETIGNCQAIFRDQQFLYPASDVRKLGRAAGF